MSDLLLEMAYRLTQERRAFVLATVVWCERPASAKPGAQALIQEDGQLSGWVGGSCTQPIVEREARRVLREGGEPYLLRLGAPPRPGMSEMSGSSELSGKSEMSGVRSFPMTCASGGALDIYMEPHLPLPQLLLVGESPIVAALAQMGSTLDFVVSQVDEAGLAKAELDPRAAILIATHGQYDENVLATALVSPAGYVGLVSSRRRADACRAYLREHGLSEEQIARLRAPAGLDIGASTPGEIAASILAELVHLRRQTPVGIVEIAEEPMSAVDPVCGMSVEIAGARHTSVYDGRAYYFCCPACKGEFEREPEKYGSGRK